MKVMFSACVIDEPNRNALRFAGGQNRLGKPVEVILAGRSA
jgi:hypothetical protein